MSDKFSIFWDPQPKQFLWLKNPAFESLFGGSKGPGKTDALLAGSTRYIQNPKYKAIIFRRTFPKMTELISRSHELFHKIGKWSDQKKLWTFPNINNRTRPGATLRFMHMESEDDKYNIQGHEYHFMGWDQLEEFTFTQYIFGIQQCRSTVDGIVPYSRATANPIGVGHAWVKDRFIDRCKGDGIVKYFKREKTVNGEIEVECKSSDPLALSRSFVQANLEDNQILMKKDPQYIKILNMLPEDLRKALKDGDWNALIGQYFTEWRPHVNVISNKQFKAMIEGKQITRVIGLDYGFKKPSSVGWYAVLPEGTIVRYRELYVEGKTYTALAEDILELSCHANGTREKIDYMVADSSIWGDVEHHREPKDGHKQGESGYDKMAQVLSEYFPILMADKRRVVGWTRMREVIENYENQHGQMTAMFLVVDCCKNFIRTIVGLVHDKHKPEDVDTTGEDHAQDEARYVIMSRPQIPKGDPKPQTPNESFWKRVEADIRSDQVRQDDSNEEPIESEMMEEGSEIIEG